MPFSLWWISNLIRKLTKPLQGFETAVTRDIKEMTLTEQYTTLNLFDTKTFPKTKHHLTGCITLIAVEYSRMQKILDSSSFITRYNPIKHQALGIKGIWLCFCSESNYRSCRPWSVSQSVTKVLQECKCYIVMHQKAFCFKFIF